MFDHRHRPPASTCAVGTVRLGVKGLKGSLGHPTPYPRQTTRIHRVVWYRSIRCKAPILPSSGWRSICLRSVRVMRCTACGAELILTNVVPDDTLAVRGVEHHTFICSGCHVTEHRVVFIKGGRETDSPPMPMQVAQRIRRASTEQDEHVAAPGLLSRVVALLRGQ